MRDDFPLFLALVLCLLCHYPLKGQEMVFHGFADVTYLLSEESSEFSLGQYDQYITAQISDKVTFLGEVVFEYDEGWVADVERVVLAYHFNDYLVVEAGKHHTPIGHWNTAFHHGAVLQPSIHRPLLVAFEDEGGLLPVHTTGIGAWGRLPGNVTYDIMVGNGIGSSAVSDNNRSKAFVLGLKKELFRGFRVGVSAYFDTIAAGTASLRHNDEGPILLATSIDQRLTGGSVTFKRGPFEFLSEIQFITNIHTASRDRSIGYYVFSGYAAGRWTPYLRFDYLSLDPDELFFEPGDVSDFVAGLRFDMSFISSIRAEYHFLNDRNENGNHLIIQFAIGF